MRPTFLPGKSCLSWMLLSSRCWVILLAVVAVKSVSHEDESQESISKNKHSAAPGLGVANVCMHLLSTVPMAHQRRFAQHEQHCTTAVLAIAYCPAVMFLRSAYS